MAAAAAILLCSTAAKADDTGVQAVVALGAAGLAVGVADLAFSSIDLARLAGGRSSGTGYAAGELALSIPQLAVATGLAVKPPPADGARTLSIAWAIWSAALATHAIWSLTPGTQPQPANLRLSPVGLLVRF